LSLSVNFAEMKQKNAPGLNFFPAAGRVQLWRCGLLWLFGVK
jgi:hypothetical protein